MSAMSGPLPLVVIIPTKNEERNIARTVSAVVDEVEAVVVVDSGSTDETIALAAKHGAQTVHYAWDGRYPKKKQWCLDNVRTDIPWVLFLDGDETPAPALLDELRQLFRDSPAGPAAAAYDIGLRYYFAGKPLRHGYTVVKRSLLDRTRCRYAEPDDLDAPGMGEQEGHYQPIADSVGVLAGRIVHRDLDPVRTWFDRHNRYSDWEAWLEVHPAVKEQVRGLKSRSGQLFSRMPLKPLVFFLYAYLARRGFVDGRAGFDYAVALSFYRWQTGVKKRELERSASGTPAVDGPLIEPLQPAENAVNGERLTG